ncbi:transcriptional regulator [Citricoccus zhacaiensis]|uniref:Transcriptional regulator n=1 Tax=Citricoccus zhacaiensis TaxID=489142 RepID=A0ABQ2MCZ1_9MICC|nr:helix-turn-helix domain-containing protein [Citricoccus zhacaiensis]GGO49532.1 transcriptional regulator [Citricoccus zhacaiensis]
MDDDWLSTGSAAEILGVSRQHIVDLCDRGDLPSIKVGTHRRIRRDSLARLIAPQLTRNQERSLWLHRAVLGALMMEPAVVLQSARDNIARWKCAHRPDGKSVHYLDQWSAVIEGGVDQVAAVLTGTDELSCELRQNSPFASVLTDEQRQQVLRSFQQHWRQDHSGERAA